MTSNRATSGTVFKCPECGRVASVPEWCKRPICAHSWGGGFTPEVWDGDDWDGEGQPIELAPHKPFRTPGPNTWTAMEPIKRGAVGASWAVDALAQIVALADRDTTSAPTPTWRCMGEIAREALASLDHPRGQ